MNHLITGAGGFLGAHLIEAIFTQDPKAQISSVGVRAPQNPKVRHLECDLLETPKLKALFAREKPERIYHLAGSARVDQSIGMPDYFRSNFLTSQSLLEALADYQAPCRLFFASSVHVYGNQSEKVDESIRPSPNGFYGMSKYLCERAFEEFPKKNPFVQVAVGRLYSCIGPGQGPGFVTADLTRRLVEMPSDAKVLETGPLTAFRQFLDVRDATALIAKLLEKPLASPYEVFNIASPEERQVGDVIKLLVKVAGKTVELQPRPTQGNPFRGLKLGTEKIQELSPDFAFRPIETTLADLWQWGQKAFKAR